MGYTSAGLGKDINDLIGDKIRESDEAATELWGALANVSWFKDGVEDDGFSFRSAGSLISEIQGKGCYIDWYCSGVTSTVPKWIAEALATRGWTFDAEKWGPPIDYLHCNDDYDSTEGWGIKKEDESEV